MPSETTTVRSTNPVTILLTSNLSVLILRLFLGGMFIYSSMDKVQDPAAFAIAVRAYKLLPLELSNLFALALGWSELIAGIMLVLGIMTRRAAGAIFILLAMFTVAIASTIVRGMVVDCGCFSNEGGGQTNYLSILRNLFLLTATAIVILFDRGFLSISKAFSKRAPADAS